MTNTANSGPVAIALVHGGFVDGSGWEDVYRILKEDGYDVALQNPTTTLADDVAATQRVIADKKGPVLLVGHSYGGVVITEPATPQTSRALCTLRRSPLIVASRWPA